MKYKAYAILIVACLLLPCAFTQAAQVQEISGDLVLRLAQEDSKAAVAVDVYLDGRLLKAEVLVVMQDSRPNILNVTLRGPGTGTLAPSAIEFVYAKPEEEDVYETIKRGGFIPLGKKVKEKELTGKRTRKMFVFEIPKDKIRKDGAYELKVAVASIKQEQGSKSQKTMFIFPLEKFSEMVLASS